LLWVAVAASALRAEICLRRAASNRELSLTDGEAKSSSSE
jgi:hypothetical protein